jgi:hypothetical protein
VTGLTSCAGAAVAKTPHGSDFTTIEAPARRSRRARQQAISTANRRGSSFDEALTGCVPRAARAMQLESGAEGCHEHHERNTG